VNSITTSTLKQYDSNLRGWWNFAHTKNVDIFTAKTTDVIEFLNIKFQTGAKYSTLNTARAAISLISSYDINKDGLLSRFMKGIFKQCPTKPRYVTTWDVSPVLDYLDKQHPITRLNLKVASQKLATLLALTTAQRLQTLALINVDNISVAASNISIKITENIKTSRLGSFQPDLVLPFFKNRPGLCVASVVLDFVNITKELRGHNIKNLSLQRSPLGQHLHEQLVIGSKIHYKKPVLTQINSRHIVPNMQRFLQLTREVWTLQPLDALRDGPRNRRSFLSFTTSPYTVQMINLLVQFCNSLCLRVKQFLFLRFYIYNTCKNKNNKCIAFFEL